MTVLCAIADCAPDAVPESLQAVGAAAPLAILAPAQEDVWEHARRVSSLMDVCAVLPARFGTTMTAEQAEAFVRSRRDELRTALSQVRGAVEVGVHARIVDERSERGGAATGTAYLLGLRDHSRAMQGLERWLAPLSDHSRAHVPAPGASSESRLRLSYLVDREGLARFVDAVAEIDAAHPECELVCTGPWPPYSFAGALP